MQTMVRRIGTAVLAAVTLWGATTLVIAQDMAELEVDHALTFELATPHTDWAQPYAGGKTRVLFFVNGRGTEPRQCVELMQRFDIEAEAVFWTRIVDSKDTHWHGGETGERRMLNLLAQEWDCYVFLGLDLSKMSSEQQYKILKPVSQGAGIVFLASNDKRVLKPANRLTPLPQLLTDGPAWEAFTVGQGRGVRIPRYAAIPYSEEWQVGYDYEAEQAGRAILWAAGKEPSCSLNLRLPSGELIRGTENSVDVSCTGAPLGPEPVVQLRVRNMLGDESALNSVPFSPGNAGSVALPLLPAGNYHVDGWIRSTKGVEAWCSVPVSICSSRRLAEIALDRTWGEVGDRLTGKVTLDGAPIDGEAIRVCLLDRRRRELMRQDLTGGTFDFGIEEWMPMLLTVRAEILDDTEVVDSVYTYFQVTKRRRNRFNFLMWDVPRGTLAPYAEENLVRHSVTLQLGRKPPLVCSAFDVPWVPYTTRIMAKHNEDGTMKPFCWNDDEAVAAHLQEQVEKYMCAREHGVFVWSLGDEVDTQGACVSPHCAEAYRRYLRQEHGNLPALNRSWGTTFTNWSEVGLSKEGDTEEAASLNAGNYARWFDRHAFKSWNFVQFCQKYLKAYAAVDPQARTGFEGAGRFEKGDDIDLIVRNNTFWSPYPGTADEVIRSIAPRDFPRANWMGYTKDADTLLRKYWRMVTRGMDSVWWWRWDCIGRFHGWLAPDLRPFPAVTDILQDTQVVRDGLGDLLLKYEMQDDGIALLYSYPSTFAHKLEDGSGFGGCESAHLGAHGLVRELGLQFRYVTDRMLRLGEFEPSRFRVLLLARADAIGEAEAAAIRQFVQDGGTVIADVRAGTFDGHCKPREHGVLDDLFGIRRDGLGKVKTVEHELLGKLAADEAVSPADGTADVVVDGVPLFIRKTTGSGRTLFLNFSFAAYPKLDVAETPEGAADVISAALKDAGVTPVLAVTGGNGARERHLETTRWLNGDVQICSLFRSAGKPSDATVALPEKVHVYDLRNRTYLGKRDTFNTRILPDRASFFALCPGKAPRVKLTAASRKASRGTVLDVSLATKRSDSARAFRLSVEAEGQVLDWAGGNLIVGSEPVHAAVPIAYNDPTGMYTIKAVELFSGCETCVRVKVRD